ncbi:hypothetical protein D3C75_944950 [compost metagenome]
MVCFDRILFFSWWRSGKSGGGFLTFAGTAVCHIFYFQKEISASDHSHFSSCHFDMYHSIHRIARCGNVDRGCTLRGFLVFKQSFALWFWRDV